MKSQRILWFIVRMELLSNCSAPVQAASLQCSSVLTLPKEILSLLTELLGAGWFQIAEKAKPSFERRTLPQTLLLQMFPACGL